MTITKICPICNTVFTTSFKHKIYCSNKCRKQHKSPRYQLYNQNFKTPLQLNNNDIVQCSMLKMNIEKLNKYNASHGTCYSYGHAKTLHII